MAFHNIEPFGFAGEMYGHAQTAAVIANVHRSKNTPPYTASDFMPQEPEPPQTMDQMLELVKGITAAFGGSLIPEEGEP